MCESGMLTQHGIRVGNMTISCSMAFIHVASKWNDVACLNVQFGLFQVSELQRYDQQYKEQINQAITYAEKLVANKMSKPQYIDAETATENKRKDINSKLEALLENL